MMKDLLKEIVGRMVNHPEQILVNEVSGEVTIILDLSVAEEDIRIVYGRGGENIKALQVLLESAAKRLKKRLVFDFAGGHARLEN